MGRRGCFCGWWRGRRLIHVLLHAGGHTKARAPVLLVGDHIVGATRVSKIARTSSIRHWGERVRKIIDTTVVDDLTPPPGIVGRRRPKAYMTLRIAGSLWGWRAIVAGRSRGRGVDATAPERRAVVV